jgi:hypothetical protein
VGLRRGYPKIRDQQQNPGGDQHQHARSGVPMQAVVSYHGRLRLAAKPTGLSRNGAPLLGGF